MTVAVCLKVNDGLVLAADSASALMQKSPDGKATVINVYNSASKVFHLVKGLPVGGLTWGSGSIGAASISTLVKDFRGRLISGASGPEWKIDPGNYTVEGVAGIFKRFMFDECYETAFHDWPQKPDLGFIVAGYSSGNGMAEEYQIDIRGGACTGPRKIRNDRDCGVTWSGEPEAINRLVLGFSTQLPVILETKLGMPRERVAGAVEIIKSSCTVPFVMAPMPIRDAIDLAKFLVETTEKFSRFSPGPQTVGGPIEIAAITKHEGFKWIRRKHYYPSRLNQKK